jgi:hypothetical protein
MTNPLSPAAQAVLDAFFFNWADEPLGQDRQCLAAALRAAADQFNSVEAMPGAPFCRNKLLAIANELENING